MPKKNNPGCYCCPPYGPGTGDCFVECGDDTTESLLEVEWEITVPDTLDWWVPKTVSGIQTRAWVRIRGTGFSVFSGTYICTKDGGCNFTRTEEVATIPFQSKSFGRAETSGICGQFCPTERPGNPGLCSLDMSFLVLRNRVSLFSRLWWILPQACPNETECTPNGRWLEPGWTFELRENFDDLCTEQTFSIDFPTVFSPFLTFNDCSLFEQNQIVLTYKPTLA